MIQKIKDWYHLRKLSRLYKKRYKISEDLHEARIKSSRDLCDGAVKQFIMSMHPELKSEDIEITWDKINYVDKINDVIRKISGGEK